MSNTNLPSLKRFYSEDYPKAPDWFQRFLASLNLYTEPVYNILNQGVDLTMNMDEEIYVLNINNVSATAPNNAVSFTPKKFVGPPHGVLIGQCLWNTTNGIATAIGNPVTLDWVWTGSQVKILAIYNLTGGASYTLSLRIY